MALVNGKKNWGLEIFISESRLLFEIKPVPSKNVRESPQKLVSKILTKGTRISACKIPGPESSPET